MMKVRSNGRKIILAALCLCTALALLPAAASAASDPSQYTFDIGEGNISITQGSASDTIKVAYGNHMSLDNIPATQTITVLGESRLDDTSSDAARANCISVDVNNATSGSPLSLLLNQVTIQCTRRDPLKYSSYDHSLDHGIPSYQSPLSIASGSQVSLSYKTPCTLSAGGYGAGIRVPVGASIIIIAVLKYSNKLNSRSIIEVGDDHDVA